ncbi:DNA-directed RNA polymerase subunit beta [Lederbergia lenta]|uniref:DNA-directed RNA polymerase subunit beta n=1 Tax=Lederbergia lenta TaxID=1467 RepID=A0A2X4WTS5_LEDLE|nr:DNA-directed RNA polymerase subunit beta [Lederbergia lenta]MCM3112038.1 DNA-directed RNA polymerase subunit beta [Lederbergia lenta]MEC2323208.1 DNA-directed RNA polymerase subunit beta [Lederbergia lenta]SQI63028.1 DNA-directed RNA polymerase subunit beta [Lederbergia lenta]
MAAKQISQAKVQTREDIKKNKKQEVKTETQTDEVSRIRIRFLPIWLRVFLVIILTAASLVAGVMVGYGVLGDGKPTDALQKKTWTHIIDIVVEKK